LIGEDLHSAGLHTLFALMRDLLVQLTGDEL